LLETLEHRPSSGYLFRGRRRAEDALGLLFAASPMGTKNLCGVLDLQFGLRLLHRREHWDWLRIATHDFDRRSRSTLVAIEQRF
jgi:hypothetical protein